VAARRYIRPAAEVIPTPRCTTPLRPYNYLLLSRTSLQTCHVGAQLVHFACCCESQVTDFLTSRSSFTLPSVLTGFHISVNPFTVCRGHSITADRLLSCLVSPRRPGFAPRSVLVGFNIISPLLFSHSYVIWGMDKGPVRGPVPHRYGLTPSQQ
jgi:hypothetical protein